MQAGEPTRQHVHKRVRGRRAGSKDAACAETIVREYKGKSRFEGKKGMREDTWAKIATSLSKQRLMEPGVV